MKDYQITLYAELSHYFIGCSIVIYGIYIFPHWVSVIPLGLGFALMFTVLKGWGENGMYQKRSKYSW